MAVRDDACQRGREPVIRDDGSVEIPLTSGQIALVDLDDYDLVKDRKWYAVWAVKTKSFYALSCGPRSRGGRWRAQIRVSGKERHIGYFRTEEEAARAYDAAALQSYGAFAFTNAMAEQCRR